MGNGPAVGMREQPEIRRVDLRLDGCFPYPPVENQGSDVSCVAHAFSMLVYCLKNTRSRIDLPHSGRVYPDMDGIFANALEDSHDRKRGVSFGSVKKHMTAHHSEDLTRLGYELVTLPNSPAVLCQHLEARLPVVAGYQVDEEIEKFHRSHEHCRAHSFVLPRLHGPPRSGHAVLVVGYDKNLSCFIVRNSWGAAWGVDGHFLVEFRHLTDPEFFTDLMSAKPLR